MSRRAICGQARSKQEAAVARQKGISLNDVETVIGLLAPSATSPYLDKHLDQHRDVSEVQPEAARRQDPVEGPDSPTPLRENSPGSTGKHDSSASQEDDQPPLEHHISPASFRQDYTARPERHSSPELFQKDDQIPPEPHSSPAPLRQDDQIPLELHDSSTLLRQYDTTASERHGSASPFQEDDESIYSGRIYFFTPDQTDSLAGRSSPTPSIPSQEDNETALAPTTSIQVLPTMASPPPQPPAKRPCLGKILPCVPNPGPTELLQSTTWVRGAWLNEALGSVYDTQPDVVLLDSCELQKIATGRGYSVRKGLALKVSKSKTILLPLHVSDNHWCLGVIEHAQLVATDIRVYNSLPSSESTAACRHFIARFIQYYLPETDVLTRIPIPYLSNLQPNLFDCGVYVFVFSLFTLARKRFPAEVCSGLWRRVMFVLLGGEMTDLEFLIPQLNQDPPDGPDTPHHPDQCADAFSRLRADEEALNKRKQKFRQQIERDMIALDSWHFAVSPTIQVLTQLINSAAQRVSELSDRLSMANSLDSLLGAADHADEVDKDSSSSTRLADLHERTSRTLGCLKKVAEELHRQNDRVMQDYGVLVERSTVLTKNNV